jgi:hypothetical protein
MTHPEEHVEIDPPRRRQSQPKDGRVTLIVSSSVLAALSGGLGALGVDQFGTDRETRERLLTANIRAQVLEDVARTYLAKDIADERWQRFSQRLEDQLAGIRAELQAMRRQIELEKR